MSDDTILHQNAVEDVIEVEVDRLTDQKTATTAQLASLTSVVNTVDKHVGKMVFNTTTSLPVWAVGAAENSLWLTHAGATAHTPV